MERIQDASYSGWDGSADTGEALAAMQAPGHGSFDNDVDVVTRTLVRIRAGKKLLLPVDDLRGY